MLRDPTAKDHEKGDSAKPAYTWSRSRLNSVFWTKTTLSISSPANRLVFQRNLEGNAVIPVAGICAWPGATVEARIVDVASGNAGDWTRMDTVRPDFSFRGRLTVAAGWYSLELRALSEGDSAAATVERVGVGEVFVVVGHSVAHGGQINLPGAEDDRVNTIALPAGEMESPRQYKLTGDARFLPEPVGRHFDANVQPAPATVHSGFVALRGDYGML